MEWFKGYLLGNSPKLLWVMPNDDIKMAVKRMMFTLRGTARFNKYITRFPYSYSTEPVTVKPRKCPHLGDRPITMNWIAFNQLNDTGQYHSKRLISFSGTGKWYCDYAKFKYIKVEDLLNEMG